MKRIIVFAAAICAAALTAKAGGYVTNSNQNVAYLRNPAQNAVIGVQGGYQGAQKQMVICACSNKEMYQIQKIVKKVDPQSFLIVLESKEVHGEGFRTIQVGGET